MPTGHRTVAEFKLTSLPPFSRLTGSTATTKNDTIMTTATGHPYIVCTEEILHGAPIVAGTRTPVRAIAELWKFGVAPEEIIGRLPHLTLAQVFDALSYYQEHREAVDEDIRRNRVPAEKMHPRLQ
jgi:uncharacterized protein (DUF433 family)